MSPVHAVLPVGKSRRVAIWPDGTITFPAEVVRHVSWKIGSRIAVSYLSQMLILLLTSRSGQPGFALHNVGHADEQGTNNSSKIRVSRLTNRIIRPRIGLPLQDLEPIYLPESTGFDMALLLEPWPWMETDFSAGGAEAIPARQVGLYQIVSADGRILRIGEGMAQARCREHLKNSDLVRSGRVFRYMCVEKTDGVMLEQIALAEYKVRFGTLPPFNAITQ